MNKSLSYKKLFLTAGIIEVILILLKALLDIGHMIGVTLYASKSCLIDLHSAWIIFGEPDLITIISIPFGIIAFISCILLIFKRDVSIPYTILRGIVFLFAIFSASMNVIGTIINIFYNHNEVLDTLKFILLKTPSFLSGVLSLIAAGLVILLCILSLVHKDKRGKLLSLWFIPVIFSAIGWLLSALDQAISIFTGYSLSGIVILNTYISAIFLTLGLIINLISLLILFLFCFTVNKANKQKSELARISEQSAVEESALM